MTKTVYKNVGKGWAVVAGLFFLVCACFKFISYLLPRCASMMLPYFYDGNQYITVSVVMSIIEIIAYLSLALLAFSGKRSNAVLIPISMLAFVIIDNAAVRITYIINDFVTIGIRYSIFADILLLIFALLTGVSFLLLMIEVNINVSCERGGVAIKILATIAILIYLLGYGVYLVGDILEYFTSFRFEHSMLSPVDRIIYLIAPAVDNFKQLVSFGGFSFLCIWMAVKRKEVEIYVPDKITDEELFKDVVVDPNLITVSAPEEESVSVNEENAIQE